MPPSNQADHYPSTTSEVIVPFEINIDQADLKDLQARLRRARLPDSIPNAGWDYGIDADYFADLLGYWRSSYDWRKAEKSLNAWPHFRTVIDEVSIHFVHVRSSYPEATPLLIVHGWPGSIVEFLGMAERLVKPEKFGGRAEDAFHLVLPSLPGYGFSGPPRERGWDPRRIAVSFTELMARLGYHRYGVQGGDWGSVVVTEMARADEGHVIGLHTNMPFVPRPADAAPLKPQELTDLVDMQAFMDTERAYALLQGSKPQTIGVALNDSPAGLCAWIAEKFYAWSDCGGDLHSVIDRDALLTNVMIYWLTGSAASSARLYFENARSASSAQTGRIETPTAVARFPKEFYRLPRAWVEEVYNVVRWTELPKGGHFAALEQPALFADDVAAFFRQLRTLPRRQGEATE